VKDSKQLVLVIAADWDATKGSLQCYTRPELNGPCSLWMPVDGPIPVTLGRTGLAWGRGLVAAPPLPGPVKREGDGKSPAGAFELPFAFGYMTKAKAIENEINFPYTVLTATTFGVDDVKSMYYNQIVSTDVVTKDWDSAETMRRRDGLYEIGVFVNHNTSPAVPGAGSCIFMHVWRGPDKPTAGCTAMDRVDMFILASWLDPPAQAKPVLVQLPRDAYKRLAKPWGLPGI
jgi:hypothetical protein